MYVVIKLTVVFFFLAAVSFFISTETNWFILAETNWFISTETNWLVAGKTDDLAGKAINFIQDSVKNAEFVVQSVIGRFKYFLPAALVKNQALEQTIFSSDDEFEESVEEDVGSIEDEKESGGGPEASLEEIQENIDDISEKIDIVAQEIFEIIGEKTEENKIFQENELETEEPQKDEEESDKIEDIEDAEKPDVVEETMLAKEEAVLCQKSNEPFRNALIFNEIAWVGGQNSANDEWIELKNISGEEINLSDWQLINGDGKIKIIFAGDFTGERVSPEGLFLLERTNDDSVLGVTADFIYSGALGNNGEILYLFDEKCQLQDEIIAGSGWLAGDNDSKRTMERKADSGWQTSFASGGTPKKQNSGGYFAIPTSGGGGVSPPAPSQQISYPKILISEIQISPQEQRFVELYNPNDSEVDLTGWYIQRKTASATEWNSFISSTNFDGKTIQSYSHFFIASTSEADIVLALTLTENNSLVLKNPNREITDMIGWGQAQDFETASAENPEQEKSIGRIWDSPNQTYFDANNNSTDFEIQNPTPKQRNNSLPTASFGFSPENPFVGEEIIFDASSSTDADGQISFYSWDFGDANSTTTNLSTTTHSFAASREFLIELLVVDDREASSSPATTTVSVAPVPQPILGISTSTLIFRAEETESNPSSQNLTIENTGDGELNWAVSTIYDSILTDWLLISQATGTVFAYSSSTLEISVDISGLATGTYQATTIIEAAGAENSPQEISISLTIYPKTIKTVIINEIAWMGTSAENPSDEWIEFYNNTASVADITGWKLTASDNSPSIVFSTSSVSANSFYLIERTDDNAVSDILADWFGSFGAGGLNNSGEKLELRDADDNLIDLVDCSFGWFAGTTTSYSSMERIDSSVHGSYSDNWANNNGIIKSGLDAGENQINGTPKSENSVAL